MRSRQRAPGAPWLVVNLGRRGHDLGMVFWALRPKKALMLLGRSPRSPQPQPMGLGVHGRWVLPTEIQVFKKPQLVSRDRCVHTEMHTLCVFLDLLRDTFRKSKFPSADQLQTPFCGCAATLVVIGGGLDEH